MPEGHHRVNSAATFEPYRFTIDFVACTSLPEKLYDWAVRELEAMPGVYVQCGGMERMDAADVISGSPLAKFLAKRNA